MHLFLLSILLAVWVFARQAVAAGSPVPTCSEPCLNRITSDLCPGIPGSDIFALHKCLCPTKVSDELRKRMRPCLEHNSTCKQSDIHTFIRYTYLECKGFDISPSSTSSASSSSLSSGAKAGIGIGVALVVLLVIGLVGGWIFLRRRRLRDLQESNPKTDAIRNRSVSTTASSHDVVRAELGDGVRNSHQHQMSELGPPAYETKNQTTAVTEKGSGTVVEKDSLPVNSPVELAVPSPIYELPTAPDLATRDMDTPSTAVEPGADGFEGQDIRR